MSETYGPFSRSGEPGGPGCRCLGRLPIRVISRKAGPVLAELFDPGGEATEVELLRTVVAHFGVQWGHDSLGWWAVVPKNCFK